MSSDLLNVLTILSIIVGGFSLVVSIIAIVVTVRYKHETDITNQDTKNTLARIEGVAATIKDDIMGELRKYGEVSRTILIENNRSTRNMNEVIEAEAGKPSIIGDNG